MANSLARAMKRSKIEGKSLGYLNAHGTATLLNDQLEASAFMSLQDSGLRPAISSTKGATGHLLGATGAVEMAFTLLSLAQGQIPCNLNLSEPEFPALDFVMEKARWQNTQAAATVSFGFGGAMASLVIGA